MEFTEEVIGGKRTKIVQEKKELPVLSKGNRDDISKNGINNKFLLNIKKKNRDEVFSLMIPSTYEVTWHLLGKTLMLPVTTGRAHWISSPCGEKQSRAGGLRGSPQEPALNSLMHERNQSSTCFYINQ